MVEGHDDRIVQRGFREALSCQDRLERIPIKPSWGSRVVLWSVAIARGLASDHPIAKRRGIPSIGNGTVTR